MSFFPPSAFVTNSDSSFHPLFRLLDDFDQYSRGSGSGSTGTAHHHRTGGLHHPALKHFTPKFDVKELADAYELHGELPGIEQENVEIEFIDAQTLAVKGRVERHTTTGTPPSDRIEGAAAKGAITEGDDASASAAHRATVEDVEEGSEENKDKEGQVVAGAAAGEEVQARGDGNGNGNGETSARFWVSERSVGEFSRSFTFPVRVDQERVTASMKNGVLSITVPKSKKVEGRKIQIS